MEKKLTSRDAHTLFVLEFKNITFIHNLTVAFLTSLTLSTVDLNVRLLCKHYIYYKTCIIFLCTLSVDMNKTTVYVLLHLNKTTVYTVCRTE